MTEGPRKDGAGTGRPARGAAGLALVLAASVLSYPLGLAVWLAGLGWAAALATVLLAGPASVLFLALRAALGRRGAAPGRRSRSFRRADAENPSRRRGSAPVEP